ncbi:MAG: alanine racemase [Alphaproteobacteria bacterium]|nr:alanine racemase [Alphaproteobacteria bacterium]
MSQPNFAPATLSIRLGAVLENFRTIRRLAGPSAVAAVVKADAYGLGMERVATALAARAGCDAFFVARHGEGVALRTHVPSSRIYVLDGAPADLVPALIANRLTPVLNSLADVASWSAAARSMNTELDAVLHIDTGMNRLGISGEELSVLAAESAKRLSGLNVVLVMSHLACADDPNARLNRVQLDRFRTALAVLPSAPASLASSAGVLLGKDFAFDLVRPGLALYGGNPQPPRPNPFATAVKLCARVIQVRRVDKGDSVGYGADYRAQRPTTIATVALGYADGLMRANGNRGSVALSGKRARIVGRVSMDLCSVDVTDVDGVAPGSEVEIVGDTVTLEDVAASAQTVAYEILTSLSRRAERIYIEESR